MESRKSRSRELQEVIAEAEKGGDAVGKKRKAAEQGAAALASHAEAQVREEEEEEEDEQAVRYLMEDADIGEKISRAAEKKRKKQRKQKKKIAGRRRQEQDPRCRQGSQAEDKHGLGDV